MENYYFSSHNGQDKIKLVIVYTTGAPAVKKVEKC